MRHFDESLDEEALRLMRHFDEFLAGENALLSAVHQRLNCKNKICE